MKSTPAISPEGEMIGHRLTAEPIRRRNRDIYKRFQRRECATQRMKDTFDERQIGYTTAYVRVIQGRD